MLVHVDADLDKRILKKIKTRSIKSNPLQSSLYVPCSDAEELSFQKSIATFGIQQPLDVLPAPNKSGLPEFTLFDGYRRLQAALKAHFPVVPVYLRYDLAEMTRPEFDASFIRAGTDRRNLHTLELCRLLFRLEATETGRPNGQCDFADLAAKRFVSERIGKDLRSVSRYGRLLTVPLPIQTAVARGDLSLVCAEKVADLSGAEQEELAAKVALCEDGKIADLVRQALPKKTSTPTRATQIAGRRLKMIVGGLGDLAENFAAVDPDTLARYLSDLQDGAALIASLIAKARRKRGVANATIKANRKIPAEIQPAKDIDDEDLKFDEFPDVGFPNE